MADVLEMFAAIVIDSGILMEHRVFESAKIAERFIIDYVNSPEEAVKRGNKPKWFVSYGQFHTWMQDQPDFNVHIIASTLRIKP